MCEYDFKALHLQLLYPLAYIVKWIRVGELCQHQIRTVHGKDLPRLQHVRDVLSEIYFRPEIDPEFAADLRRLFSGGLKLRPERARGLHAPPGMVMRGRYNVPDPVLIRHPEHLLHLFDSLCPVVHTGQDMTVCVNKPFHSSFS